MYADRSAALRPAFLGVRLVANDAGETVVDRVIADMPAAAAGFADGDVIVGATGVTFASNAQVRAWAAMQNAGEPVTIDVRRADGMHTLVVTPAAFPAPEP